MPNTAHLGLVPGFQQAITAARRVDEYRVRALAAGNTPEAWDDQLARVAAFTRHSEYAVDVPKLAYDLLLEFGEPVDVDTVFLRRMAEAFRLARLEMAATWSSLIPLARLARRLHRARSATLRRMRHQYRQRQLARRRRNRR